MSKRRRLRRHHLKQWAANVIGVTRNVDKHYFREAHARAKFKDEYLTRVFDVPNDVTHDSANARRAVLGLPTSLQHSARENVQDKMRKAIKAAHMQVCLDNRVYHKLFLCWNSDYTRFYFIKKERDVKSVSISYPSRERAMWYYHRKKIKF